MFLAINIGNTNTRFGIFDGEKLIKTFLIPTKERKDYKTQILHSVENNTIEKIVIASVVPSLNTEFEFLNPTFIHELVDLGEVGADIYCGVVAAHRLYGGPGLVIDLGTATTLNPYDKNGKLLGVSIAPGLQTSHNALISQTALLRHVELKAPQSVIGTNTTTAIQSGVVLGHVSMIEGMVARFKKELGYNLQVIATGGLSAVIKENTNILDVIDSDLVLKGINFVAKG